MKKLIVIIMFCLISSVTFGDNSIANQNNAQSLRQKLQALLNMYYQNHYACNNRDRKNDDKPCDYSIHAGLAMTVSLPTDNSLSDANGNYHLGTVANELGSPQVSDNTLFGLASNTKAFAAVVILKLEEQGKINIMNPIKDYLRVCDDPTGQFCLTQQEMNAWGNITVRELMNHTSGIPEEETPAFWRELLGKGHLIQIDSPRLVHHLTPVQMLQVLIFQERLTRPWTAAQLLQFAIQEKLEFQPGTSWDYSNTNYMLLGMIIRNVTGNASIQAVMQQMIFGPYNLQHTFYYPYSLRHIAYPHGDLSRQYTEQLGVENLDITNYNVSAAQTAAAVISTTQDFALWVRSLFGGKILASAQMKEMEDVVCTGLTTGGCQAGTPNPPLTDLSYGLGVFRYNFGNQFGGVAWMHGGVGPGNSMFVYFPGSNIVITIASNVVLPSNIPFLRDLMPAVMYIILNSPEWQRYQLQQHLYSS